MLTSIELWYFILFYFIYKLCQIWPVIPTELIAPLTGYLNLSMNNIYKIVVIRCPQKDNRISETYETACSRDCFLTYISRLLLISNNESQKSKISDICINYDMNMTVPLIKWRQANILDITCG